MTSGHRKNRDRVHRPFSDPLDTFTKNPRRPSRTQRRRAESARRQQAERDVGRLATQHDAPPARRLRTYALITLGTTLVIWRLTVWLVSFVWLQRHEPGIYIRSTAAEVYAADLPSLQGPGTWPDPVGLLLGLALGLALTWIYARNFEGL